MTDREKLIELQKTNCETKECCVDSCIECMADHLLANGVTFQKWIPVALGFFPEEHGRYLCRIKSFAFPGCFYQEILHYDKYGFRDSGIYTEDVTHWMPLPEPPQEE